MVMPFGNTWFGRQWDLSDEAVFRAGQKGVEDAVAVIKKIHSNAKELNEATRQLREKYGR
jgi:hypothetical protein